MSHLVDSARMDKTSFDVVPMNDVPSDADYWLGKTPQERLAAIELMRAIQFGYDPTTARLQRLLEIVELGED